MQEIVDDVLKAEEQAEAVIQQAREKAQHLQNSVENTLSDKLKKAREDAQNRIRETVELSKARADKKYREVLEKAEEDNKEFLKENSDKVNRIIDDIVKLIITPEYKRE